MDDLIGRQAAIDALVTAIRKDPYYDSNEPINGLGVCDVRVILNDLPSAQPEPLTDKEQRIFLAAMGREEKVCAEVDRNYVREPHEDSLMFVCKEIKRKVKGALWT